MLVNLPAGWDTSPENPYAQALEDFEYSFEHLGLGLYHGLPGFAFEYLIEDEHPFEGYIMRMPNRTDEQLKKLFAEIQRQEREDLPRDYGVCDHPAQVVERWHQIVKDPRPLIINFHRLDRDWAKKSGWRWHKNGKYIGKQNPQYEHLGDEPEIETVWDFHIYQLRSAA